MALYDADKYIIRPFTVAGKRAFVEMVARAAQLPKWFVSHWWGEPVRTRVRGGVGTKCKRRGSHGAARLARR